MFRHGQIEFYDENDEHVRTEYAPTHERHGEINFYENGKNVRREFASTHERHGEIDFYENGNNVRTEYASMHKQHGEIDFYENGNNVRREFAPTHMCHGQIILFENDEHVRTEYAPMHKDHGLIAFIENGKFVRREFASTHKYHGEIEFYDENGVFVRREYASTEFELAAKNAELAAKNAELAAKNAELASKNAEIAAKNAELASKNDSIRLSGSDITKLQFLLLQSQRTDPRTFHNYDLSVHIDENEVLMDAIYYDDVDVLRQAHAAGIDVINKECMPGRWGHLHWAAHDNPSSGPHSIKCLKYLMDNGADVKARARIDEVVDHACIYNHWDFAQNIGSTPEDDADVDLIMTTSFNPLQIATLDCGRDAEVTRILRRKQYFRQGFKAFHMSAIKVRIMTVLLCAKRSPNKLGCLPAELLRRVIHYACAL